ncbi:hypothetical protein C0J52_04173, partial [Blattella germanica]
NNPTCSWYGECYTDPQTQKVKNCVDHDPARVLQNSLALEILQRRCPDIYGDGNDVRTCCDYDQLGKMDTKMKLAEGVLKRCTSCINNLLNHICQFTCSPNQSQFFIPAEILVNPDTQSKAFFARDINKF